MWRFLHFLIIWHIFLSVLWVYYFLQLQKIDALMPSIQAKVQYASLEFVWTGLYVLIIFGVMGWYYFFLLDRESSMGKKILSFFGKMIGAMLMPLGIMAFVTQWIEPQYSGLLFHGIYIIFLGIFFFLPIWNASTFETHHENIGNP